MPKLNLVLADSDPWYVDGLSKYIRDVYASKFSVNIFTQKSILEDFFPYNSEIVDILLISPDMMFPDIEQYKVKSVILLSDGRIPSNLEHYPAIRKYQPGEKILLSLIDIISKSFWDADVIVQGDKKTRLITVFSPQGGSGKTTTSFHIASQLAKKGLRTLYLSLESFSCSSLFLPETANDYGLSNILFDLKEKGRNMQLKLDAAKNYDSLSGVHYFKPFDCSLELDDLQETDMERLLSELLAMGQFDRIVIDTESTLSHRNKSILRASDTVVLLLMQDFQAKVKWEAFQAEMKKLEGEKENKILEKLVPVFNKYISNAFLNDRMICGQEIKYKIPFLNDIYQLEHDQYRWNPKSKVENYIKTLVENL